MGTTGVRYGSGKLVYLMHVDDDGTFADYFVDTRFQNHPDRIHKPTATGYELVPNVYHNERDAREDRTTDRVLIAVKDFVYFGKNAPRIPKHLQRFICGHRKHKRFDGGFEAMRIWAFSKGNGIRGTPHSPRFDQSGYIKIHL
jgi:Nucleotide modification associated domain 2